jgi:hypothetical protein
VDGAAAIIFLIRRQPVGENHAAGAVSDFREMAAAFPAIPPWTGPHTRARIRWVSQRAGTISKFISKTEQNRNRLASPR